MQAKPHLTRGEELAIPTTRRRGGLQALTQPSHTTILCLASPLASCSSLQMGLRLWCPSAGTQAGQKRLPPATMAWMTTVTALLMLQTLIVAHYTLHRIHRCPLPLRRPKQQVNNFGNCRSCYVCQSRCNHVIIFIATSSFDSFPLILLSSMCTSDGISVCRL